VTRKRIALLHLLCQVATFVDVAAAACWSQDKLVSNMAEIRGIVTADNGQPLSGVTVRSDHTECVTDGNGRYIIVMMIASTPSLNA
jgi:hypothetical protein